VLSHVDSLPFPIHQDFARVVAFEWIDLSHNFRRRLAFATTTINEHELAEQWLSTFATQRTNIFVHRSFVSIFDPRQINRCAALFTYER
jgi:hypothetical protein